MEVTLTRPVRPEDLAAAERLGLRVDAARDPTRWQLLRSNGVLELHSPEQHGSLRLDLRFREGELARRLRTARRTDPLPRAVGCNRRPTAPRVVDATAGLCRDAAVLARLGCRVQALERVPALVFLVQDALAHDGITGVELIAADAASWLAALTEDQRPDVVYLDPMFETTGKAQVKKDMQVCRALCDPASDALELLAVARAVARERVVVKRHGKAEALAPSVSFAVAGERVRFDVYLTPPPQTPTP